MKSETKRVLLDADIAEVYGVETRDINKAVANNPDEFPVGYIVELSTQEATGMHLSHEFGMTIDEILTDGFVPDETIEMLLSGDTPRSFAGIDVYP